MRLCCTLKNEQTVLQNIPLQGAERAIAVTGTQFSQRKHSGLKGTRPVPEPRSAEGTMILPLIWGRRIRTPSRMAMISLVKRFGVCPRADPGPLEYRGWQPGLFGKRHQIQVPAHMEIIRTKPLFYAAASRQEPWKELKKGHPKPGYHCLQLFFCFLLDNGLSLYCVRKNEKHVIHMITIIINISDFRSMKWRSPCLWILCCGSVG